MGLVSVALKMEGARELTCDGNVLSALARRELDAHLAGAPALVEFHTRSPSSCAGVEAGNGLMKCSVAGVKFKTINGLEVSAGCKRHVWIFIVMAITIWTAVCLGEVLLSARTGRRVVVGCLACEISVRRTIIRTSRHVPVTRDCSIVSDFIYLSAAICQSPI